MASQTNNKKAFPFVLIFLIALALIFVLTIVSVLGYFALKRSFVSIRNEQKAEKVAALIDDLSDKEITIDSEDEINDILAKYDALSSKQKGMVDNYDELQQALVILEQKKDISSANKVIAAINAIDEANLTADDLSVDSAFSEYNALSENQKRLVTNIDKLNRCKATVEQKIANRNNQIDSSMELVQNFPGYQGQWGYFGVHADKYQGQIEAVIKSNFSLWDYYSCHPNSVDMKVTRFVEGTGSDLGSCEFEFWGPAKEYNGTKRIYGTISIKPDGTLYLQRMTVV